MFLIRWCNLTGFSYLGDSFILRNQFGKMSYQAGAQLKLGNRLKNFNVAQKIKIFSKIHAYGGVFFFQLHNLATKALFERREPHYSHLL
jgi:hypothetical protein